jgi:hypothetical protein
MRKQLITAAIHKNTYRAQYRGQQMHSYTEEKVEPMNPVASVIRL